jgi:uncharacterized protein
MEKKVEFKSGNDTLRGRVYIPSGKPPFPGVIFFHGSGSSGDTYFEASERLIKKGILAFMFNFRGCGISDGDFSKQTIEMGLEDAKAGLGLFLNISELDKNHVGIAGSSFGGFLTALLSSDFDFKSVVLIVPASYSPSMMNTFHTDDKKDLREDFEKSMSYEKIHNFRNNLLIVQSELDDILPSGMVEKYIEVGTNAKRKEHLILKNAKHRIKLNPGAKNILLDKLDSWFLETL